MKFYYERSAELSKMISRKYELFDKRSDTDAEVKEIEQLNKKIKSLKSSTRSFLSDFPGDTQFRLKGMIEARGSIMDEMEGIANKVRVENRKKFTPDEKGDFDALQEEFDLLTVEINSLSNNNQLDKNADILSGKRNYANNNSREEDNMSKNYSLARAIKYMVNPNDSSNDAGFELEVSQELQQRSGESLKQGEIIVPIQALKTESRDVDYSTESGNLVATEHMDSAFIDVLRNSSQVLSMGVTQLSDLKDNVKIPKKSGASTAYWFDGDSENITVSDQTFTNLSMEPHYVGALSEFTYRLLEQSSPAIEMLVRQDLADTLGSEIDRAAIDGTGSGSQPKGLMNTSGINQVSFTASGPTWAQVVTMEQNVAEDNALKGNLGFLSHPEFIGYFKTTEKASGSGQFIMDNSGRVNSYPARFSANVPGNYSIFGDWSQMVFGAWGGIKLAVNPYEKFASGSVQVRAIAAVDFAIRHTQAFEIGRVVNT